MANRAPRSTRPSRQARLVRQACAGIVVLVFGGSCAAPVIPPPAPQPRLIASPPAPPPARTPQTGWQDQPLPPGEWRWSRESGQSTARFGSPGQTVALIGCRAGTVTLVRYGSPETTGLAPTVVIRTTSTSRPNPGMAQSGSVALAFNPRDPLLDAIAFSRGRFAVEVQGMAPLPLPSWPEVARVIDDCRS